jgi:LEA14-like dessication related protein
MVYAYGFKKYQVKKLRKTLCSFLLFLWALASSALPISSTENLSISLEEKKIKDLNVSGLFLVFYVNISNSSSLDYYLSSYDYRFVVNQKEYFRLSNSLEKYIHIKAKEKTLLSFPLKITYEHLFRVVKGVEKEDKAQCYLTGTMVFSDGQREGARLPFAFSGEFPILKKPEVEFLALQVKEMTIGGAEIGFKMSFKNSNAFELLVDRIRYGFHLGGKSVGEGIISGDKNIGSGEIRVFSIPFLLNFFEVGKDISTVLHQASAPCRFFGEIEVRTAWGYIKIPFDKSDIVTISRSP